MRTWVSIAIGLSLLTAQAVRADTIVLKNGRRILALSVVEDGDKVRYQTAAGELSLPKSIVDHIERGGAVPMPSRSASAATLEMTPPTMESSPANAAAENGAIHDGAVDREFLAKAVAEARSGAPQANDAAAIAHRADLRAGKSSDLAQRRVLALAAQRVQTGARLSGARQARGSGKSRHPETRRLGVLRHEQAERSGARMATCAGAASGCGGASGSREGAARQAGRRELPREREQPLHAAL